MIRLRLLVRVLVGCLSLLLLCIFISIRFGFGMTLGYLTCSFRVGDDGGDARAGQFRPLAGANPAIGAVGELEKVEEHRVELLVTDEGRNEQIKGAVLALKEVRSWGPRFLMGELGCEVYGD